MSVKIKLYDYYDDYMWCYCGIGMGKNDAATVTAQIDAAVAAGEDIEVDINSGGGYVYDGWNIYNALIAARATVQVITINNGIAASIASIIFMAGTVRKMAKAALTMVHKPSIDPWYYGSMTADDLTKEADVLNKIQDVLASIYVDATGLDLQAVNDMINAETWLTPDSCLTLGFATEILAANSVMPEISEAVLNHAFKGAPKNIQQYANKIFNTIKPNDMAMDKATQDLLKTNNSLLQTVVNGIKKAFKTGAKDATTTLKDGTVVYHEGDLAVGVEVFTDAEMLLPVDDATYTLADDSTFTTVDGAITEMVAAEDNAGEGAEDAATVDELEAANAVLEAQVLEQADTISQLTNALKASNAALKKVQNTTTGYKPADRKNDFGKGKENPVNEAGNFKMPSKKKA